jgi:hypothetical protein
MKACIILAAFLIAPAVFGQVAQISCGDSTLFQGSGCGTSLYLPHDTAYGGIAYSSGHFDVAASNTFSWRNDLVVLGDRQVGFSFDGTGLGLTLLGASIEHKTDDSSMTAFIGTTGPAFTSPFLLAAVRPQGFGAGVFFKHKYRGANLYSLEVANSGKYTAAQGIDFQWRQDVRLAGSAGILNSEPFASGTISWHPANDWNMFADHQSIFAPYRATGDNFGVAFTDGRFRAQGSLNESDSQGKRLTGEMVGAGVQIGPVQAQVNYYKYGARTMTAGNLTETFYWHHLTLNQSLNHSAGQNSYSFGGGFVWANRLSVSLNHSIVFLLNGEGFEQVTGVSIGVRVRDATVNFQTVTTPLGQKLYSIYGSDYEQLGSWSPGSTVHAASGGKYEYSGRVLDEKGNAVSGAAVEIGRVIAYTNDGGYFSVRGKKAVPLPVTVVPQIFATPGEWAIVSSPGMIEPHDGTATKGTGAPVLIVVKRKL